jgi:N-acetylmuramoyl-L-alanine amidase
MSNWIQDAGHGGSDPGAVSHGNIEKNYTLEAALYVDKRLAEHGIQSDPSRNKDVSLPENERVALAKKYKKGNSHHFNAGGGSGVEVIHSIYSDGKYEHLLIEEFRKAGYPVRPRPVFFKKNSSGGDYYYMHRRSGNCRMTIIEYDFVDGPQAQKIKDKAYREGMYECVVRAICRDEGVTYKPVKGQTKPASKPKEEDDMLEKAILIGGFPDFAVAEVLAARIKAPVYTRAAYPGGKIAKEIYVVGGSTAGLQADKVINLSGKDRFEVAASVKKFLG